MNEYIQNLVNQVKEDFPLIDIQEVYEGWVEDIYDDAYSVRLIDCIETEEFSAEIHKSNFPDGEVKLGTIFYWYLGEDKTGKAFSEIRFTTEVWTQEQLDKADMQAKKMMASFKPARIAED